MNFTIIIANNPKSLKIHNPDYTVEAEFGQTVVEGELGTLAHHGPRSDNDAPCLGHNFSFCPLVVPSGMACQSALDEGYCDQECMAAPDHVLVAVSHFDLDTLGGVMRVLGVKPWEEGLEEDMFWKVAAMVDTMGPHKIDLIRGLLEREYLKGVDSLSEIYKSLEYNFQTEWDGALESLHAFWSWSENNKLFADKDGVAKDCTDFFREAIRVVNLLLEGSDKCKETQALYQAGREWATANKQLNEDSYNGRYGSVIVRISDKFVNHIYNTQDGVAKAIVGFNTETENITVSLESPIEGVDCSAFLQKIFGDGAGGHASIAGSPRENNYDATTATRVAKQLSKLIDS